MTQQTVAAPQPILPVLRPYWRAIVPLALLLVAALVLRPNLALLATVSLAIKIHMVAAVGAIFLGGVMLASRKGRTFHRIAGWVWVSIIATVAVSSIFIQTLSPGHFSWIHGLTAFTICESCGKVTEFHDHVIEDRLNAFAGARNFKPGKTTIEIRGHCAGCA